MRKPVQTTDLELSVMLKINEQLDRTYSINQRKRILLYLLQKHGHDISISDNGIWINFKRN